MLNKVVVGLILAVAIFVTYLVVRAYKPKWFSTQEPFRAQAKPVPVVLPAAAAVIKAAEMPQKAPTILAEPVAGPERTVAAGGPSTPNAKPPPMMPTISPDAVPLDPYDLKSMEAPIRDDLRYPERSFGPGTVNDSTDTSPSAGMASSMVNSAISTFSPEFAQNGGGFMGSVFANDLTQGDEYARA